MSQQLISTQPLPGRQLQVSGRTTPSKMTFKATGHPARVCFQTLCCQHGRPGPPSPSGSSLTYCSSLAIFMSYFFLNPPLFPEARAQVHRVLAKERSCSEQHVSNEVTFAEDRGLTSPSPLLLLSPPVSEITKKNISLTATADAAVL